MNCFGICDSLHRPGCDVRSRGPGWEMSPNRNGGRWSGRQWREDKESFAGEVAESESILRMAADKKPQRQGTPKYKRKQERGAGCVICQHKELPRPGAVKTSCPRGGLPQARQCPNHLPHLRAFCPALPPLWWSMTISSGTSFSPVQQATHTILKII